MISMSESSEIFEPQHKNIPQEILNQRGKKKIHITIDEVTAYELRHAAARLGILKRLSYDSVIRILLARFYGKKADQAKILAEE
jgi:hypothetical protein